MNPTTTVRFVAPWANILSLTLLILLPPLWGGCATLTTRFIDANEEFLKYEQVDGPSTLPRMYSGTWFDLSVVAYAFRGEGPRFHGSALFFWDIPFSLAADTVLLPLTAYEQIRYGNFGNDAPPLVLAARDGDVAMVRALVEQGTAVHVKTKGGLTASIVAAGWGRTPVVLALLEKGADVNAKTPEGWTALVAAARRGHTAVAEVLLEKGADVNAKTSEGETALMGAAEQGNPIMIQLLLDRGADIHAKNTHGWTALNWARANHPEKADAVELLKRAGAKE